MEPQSALQEATERSTSSPSMPKIKEVTKAEALRRLEILKEDGREAINFEQAGWCVGKTRSWAWLNKRILGEDRKVIQEGKITCFRDASKGKKKIYRLVSILDLEADIEKRLFPSAPKRK